MALGDDWVTRVIFCLDWAQSKHKGEVGLNGVWLLPPTTLSRTTRAHLPITARTKPSSMQERCLLSSGREILAQTSATSSHPQYLSSKNRWTVNSPQFFLQHLCNFRPNSLTIFSILLFQTICVFPCPQSPTSLCGPYLPRGHTYHKSMKKIHANAVKPMLSKKFVTAEFAVLFVYGLERMRFAESALVCMVRGKFICLFLQVVTWAHILLFQMK